MDKKNRRQLKIFALASFLNDFGSDMISPVWPLFVTSFAGANMQVLGFIDGLGDAIVSISQAISGYWSDSIGRRKPFVWIGYLCGGISRAGYALSSVWQWLIPFRVLDRAGKMRGAPRDAMIADAADDSDRGKSFGFLRTFDNLGAVCGIILSILLVSFMGYRNLFILAAVPSLVGATIIFLTIRERRRPSEQKLYKGLRFGDIDRNFGSFLALSAIFSLGAFSYSFLLVFANKAGFAIYQVPVLYLLFTFTASMFSLPFGRLSDKLKSRKTVLLIAYFLWLAVCAGLALTRAWWAIIMIFIVYGVHRAAIDTIQSTFVSELAPAGYRASSLGMFQLITGLCALPASYAAGIFWDRWGMETPFYVSAVLTIVAMVMLAGIKEKRGNVELRHVETSI
ncbi:MAG: MFS transporter [Candidatus Pacebacteria bacterium]|jgi:MFS family permease|nr:MFS transporter [Candidatus Paceibacterota bacterium]